VEHRIGPGRRAVIICCFRGFHIGFGSVQLLQRRGMPPRLRQLECAKLEQRAHLAELFDIVFRRLQHEAAALRLDHDQALQL